MDIDDLPKVTLFLVITGMLIGVGLLVLANFSDAARNRFSVTQENHTFYNHTTTTLDFTQISGLRMFNGSAEVSSAGFTYSETAGTVQLVGAIGSTYNGSQLNCTYTGYTDSDATTSTDNVVTAVQAIPGTWLTLIVTIIALAIVLGVTLKSFQGRA